MAEPYSAEDLKRMYKGMSPGMAAGMAAKNGAPFIEAPAPIVLSPEEAKNLPDTHGNPMVSPLALPPGEAQVLRGSGAPIKTEPALPEAQKEPVIPPVAPQGEPQQSGFTPWGALGMGPRYAPGLSKGKALAKVKEFSGEWNRNPEDVAKLEHAENALGLRREQMAETTATGLDQQADIYGQNNKAIDSILKAREERVKAQQAAEDAERKKLEERVKIHDEMKISDNPYWDNKTSGGKIMAAIGMIGAGFASGLGNNSANQFFQQQVQNSIDAQKQKIAKSADGINQAKGLYSDLIRKGYDADKAEILALDLGVRKAWGLAKEYAAKNEAAKAHIGAAAVPEEEAAREARIKITMADAAGSAAARMMQPVQVSAGLSPELQYKIWAEQRKDARENAKWLADKYQAAGVPGNMNIINNVKKLLDVDANSAKGIGVWASKIPGLALDDKARAQRQIVAEIKNTKGHLLFGGALSPSESAKLDAQLQGAGTYEEVMNTVKSFVADVEATRANLAAGAGADAVDMYSRNGGPVQPYVPQTKLKPF